MRAFEKAGLGALRMPAVGTAKSPAKTIFSPFLTIFGHFPGESGSGFIR